MSESPCGDDSALSPTMIRPFREIVRVWTKVRPSLDSGPSADAQKTENKTSLWHCTIFPAEAQLSRPRSASPAGLDPMTGPGPAIAVSPARAVAYAVLRRVFEQEAWADRALHGEARRAGLDARDRALATQLSYGAVQRAATLDRVIEALARAPGRPARARGARRAAARGLPAGVPGRRRAARGGDRVRRAGQGGRAARRRPGERGAAARRPRGARARRGAPGGHGGRGGRAPLASRAGSPSCGSRRSGRTPRAP